MSKDEGSSLVWLGLGALICIGSMRLSLGSFQNPGPGFFPFIAGSVLGILAVIAYFQARRRAASSPLEAKRPIWSNRVGAKKIVWMTLSLLGYVAILEYLGFLISTFIFLAFLLRTIEPQRWRLVILESLLASGVSYLVFEVWLQAQLPRGIFP